MGSPSPAAFGPSLGRARSSARQVHLAVPSSSPSPSPSTLRSTPTLTPHPYVHVHVSHGFGRDPDNRETFPSEFRGKARRFTPARPSRGVETHHARSRTPAFACRRRPRYRWRTCASALAHCAPSTPCGWPRRRARHGAAEPGGDAPFAAAPDFKAGRVQRRGQGHGRPVIFHPGSLSRVEPPGR